MLPWATGRTSQRRDSLRKVTAISNMFKHSKSKIPLRFWDASSCRRFRHWSSKVPRLVSCKEGLVLQREAERRRVPGRELSAFEVASSSALICTWYQTLQLHNSSLAGCQSPDTPPNCDAGAGKVWKSLGQNFADFCSGAERHFAKLSDYLSKVTIFLFETTLNSFSL